jgi:hypothetical protein
VNDTYDAGLPDSSAGRQPVVEGTRQFGVATRRERAALPLEVRVAAEHPGAALDTQRLSPIVESVVREIGQIVAVHHEAVAAEIAIRIDHGTRSPTSFVSRVVVASFTTPAVVAAPVPYLAGGRDAIVEPHGTKRRIFARAERHAVAAKARVFAKLPHAIPNDRGRRAIVEATVIEVHDRVVRTQLASTEVLTPVQRQVGRARGDTRAGDQQRSSKKCTFHTSCSIGTAPSSATYRC